MAKGFSGLMEMAQQEAKIQFGEDFNTDITSNFYKFSATIVLLCSYLEDKFISLKSGRNIYTAHDTQLDDLFSNDLIFRIQGARATGKATISGDDDTVIYEKSLIVKGNNELIYTNLNQGIITNGTVELDFECTTMGTNGNLPAMNFKTVQKAPTGVRDVQNKAISGGLNRETDYEYIQRYLSTIRDIDWSLPALLGAIRKLNGVVSCDGVRNNSNTDGVNGIEKKSVRVVVDGGDPKEIAQTIYSKTHTANTVGTIENNIELVPGYYQTIKFDRPNMVGIDYQYNIISQNTEEILELLKEYLNSLKVGDIVSTEEFRKQKLDNTAIEANMRVLNINFKKSSSLTYEPFIQLNYDEKGSCGTGALI